MVAAALRERRLSYQDSRTNDQQRTTSDPRLTEAELSHLWAGQRFPASALTTRQGVPVRVLHPGRAGRGAGPDFRDAIIAAPSGPALRGDIELHVRASDFRAHGHQRDQRYNRVVLHVVFEDDTLGETQLADGRCVPIVPLAPWLRRRAQELAGWLSAPSLWQEPCHDALARLGPDHVLRELAVLGDRRFEELTAVLADVLQLHGPAEALYRTLLVGLAYGSDRRLLESVAERLPWQELVQLIESARPDQSLATVEAALLGALPVGAFAGRPANRPERRLAGLARLIVRHRAVFEDVRALEIEVPPRELIVAWSSGALIGRSRAIELLVNAVLPWAAACAEARGDRGAAERTRACFARLPRPGRYGTLAFLEANLQTGDRTLPLDARSQQGLLALHKAECTQGGCGRCVLS